MHLQKLVFGAGILVFCGLALSFSLDARLTKDFYSGSEGAKAKSKVPFLDGGPAIHEQLTMDTLECELPNGLCHKFREKGLKLEHLIEGVRSNDFPATYYNQKAVPWCKGRVLRIERDRDVACMFGSLVHVQGQKENFLDQKWTRRRPVIVRGHFGDMQFLHSMAPDGRAAAETYQDIRMWMKFAYKVASGEVTLRGDVYVNGVPEMQRYFWRGARRNGDLMNYRFERNHASAIALGQILHIAQDSFSKCHAERDSSRRIVRYLSYTYQNKSKHSEHDAATPTYKSEPAETLNPVAFGKELIAFWADGAPWENVEPLIQRYFEPQDGTQPAVAGRDCK